MQTQKHRYSQTQLPTDTQTHRHTDTQTHRHTDTQTHRHTDTQTHTCTLFNSPTGLHDKKSADSYTFAPDVVPYAIRHACSLSLHHAVVGSRPAIAPPFTLITGLPEYFVHTTRSGSLRLAGIAKHCISLVLTEYDNTGVRAASFNTVAEPLNTCATPRRQHGCALNYTYCNLNVILCEER